MGVDSGADDLDISRDVPRAFQMLGGNEIHTRGRLKKLLNEQSSVEKNRTESMTLRRVCVCGKTTQIGRDLTHFRFYGQRDSQLV